MPLRPAPPRPASPRLAPPRHVNLDRQGTMCVSISGCAAGTAGRAALAALLLLAVLMAALTAVQGAEAGPGAGVDAGPGAKPVVVHSAGKLHKINKPGLSHRAPAGPPAPPAPPRAVTSPSTTNQTEAVTAGPSIIQAPRRFVQKVAPNCQPGFKPDHAGNCREKW